MNTRLGKKLSMTQRHVAAMQCASSSQMEMEFSLERRLTLFMKNTASAISKVPPATQQVMILQSALSEQSLSSLAQAYCTRVLLQASGVRPWAWLPMCGMLSLYVPTPGSLDAIYLGQHCLK